MTDQPSAGRPAPGTIGGGLALLSLFAPYYFKQIPDWLAVVGIISGVLLLLYGFGPYFRPFATRATRRLEPNNLIIIGVLGACLFMMLALAGVVWARFQTSPSEATAQQAAPTSKTGKEGVHPLPKMTYSEADISRLLDMLHDAFAYMTGEPSAIDKELDTFHANTAQQVWYAQIEKDGAANYIERLESVLDRSQKMWMSLNDFLHQSKHSYYKEQIRVALNLDRQPDGFHQSISQFVRLLKLLPAKPEHNTLRIMDEPFGSYLDIQRSKWKEWVGGSLTRIGSMTDNLRKNGTTGFEKK